MQHVKIELENCYGIKQLQTHFDFSNTQAYALYAPNGVMKSSLAKAFQDAADDKDSEDRIFPDRITTRNITDEHHHSINGRRVFVILPYDAEFGVNEQTSTLLLDRQLKAEYDDLLRDVAEAKQALLAAIRAQSHSRMNIEQEISSAIMPTPFDFDSALIRIKREVDDLQNTILCDVVYDTIFSEKVLTALDANDLKNAIQEYAGRYNELLNASIYFKKGTFDYYNANQIARALETNGFFAATHSVNLNSSTGTQEIESKAQLEELIIREKEAILSDKVLQQRFDTIARQLMRNNELRQFFAYVRDNEALLARLHNPIGLKQEVIKAYLKVHENLYNDWMEKYDAAEQRRKELEEEAQRQRTQWEAVIDIFNTRFFVPFKLEAKNKADVALGRTSIIDLGFTYIDGNDSAETYIDGNDSAELERGQLLQSLSTGERKALYVLNVIFEIETRKTAGQETLVIVDDLADSFDYRNKYAIIQYLKDISEEGLFKLIIMTHNFDFFRTVESRFVQYSNCLAATKNDRGITLSRASGIRNIFAKDWKLNFFNNTRKKIASIPFLRNIIEMTTGENDPRYKSLTAMLHWKTNSSAVTIGELENIFKGICGNKEEQSVSEELVYEVLIREAEECVVADAGMKLENKIVLAMAIRLMAERYIIDEIGEPQFVESLEAHQARSLTERFRSKFSDRDDAIEVLDRVNLMTPENIHVNSFMYEPIIDLSDDHLRRLYRDLKELAANTGEIGG